jgi:hypothetical protein
MEWLRRALFHGRRLGERRVQGHWVRLENNLASFLWWVALLSFLCAFICVCTHSCEHVLGNLTQDGTCQTRGLPLSYIPNPSFLGWKKRALRMWALRNIFSVVVKSLWELLFLPSWFRTIRPEASIRMKPECSSSWESSLTLDHPFQFLPLW